MRVVAVVCLGLSLGCALAGNFDFALASLLSAALWDLAAEVIDA